MHASDRKALLELLKKFSFQKREVVLASGVKSDYYIDCKRTLLCGEGHLTSGRLLFQALNWFETELGYKMDAVAGVELGGCSIASSVSMVAALSGRELPAVYVRKTIKDHGTKNELEGPDLIANFEAFGLLGKPHVALVEDVITSGKSALAAIDKLQNKGYEVSAVLGVVDREGGGSEILKSKHLKTTCLFSLKDFS